MYTILNTSRTCIDALRNECPPHAAILFFRDDTHPRLRLLFLKLVKQYTSAINVMVVVVNPSVHYFQGSRLEDILGVMQRGGLEAECIVCFEVEALLHCAFCFTKCCRACMIRLKYTCCVCKRSLI